MRYTNRIGHTLMAPAYGRDDTGKLTGKVFYRQGPVLIGPFFDFRELARTLNAKGYTTGECPRCNGSGVHVTTVPLGPDEGSAVGCCGDCVDRQARDENWKFTGLAGQ